MAKRCYCTSDPSYPDWGGRGITVCDRWRDSFENFYEDMGDAPEGTSIGRIDNDGNYCPENCRWETCEQQANNKRNNVLLTYKGVTKSILQWSKELGVSYNTLHNRYHNGWDLNRMFEQRFKKVDDILTVHGDSATASEWSILTDIPMKILVRRKRAGWNDIDNLSTPALNRGKRRVTGK